MIKKVDIKKELSEEEFKNILIECEHKFKLVNNILEIARGCEEKTREITPAKDAFVLIARPDTQEFEIVTQNKTIPMNLKIESILSECYTTKQPLIVNDATRSFLYSKKVDNFFNLEVKDLLLIPVIDDSKDKNVLAIVWAAIPAGSWNQFTQKDLNYMTRFYVFIKRFLHKKELITNEITEGEDFLDYIDAYENLTAKTQREQEYFSSIIHDIRTPMNAVMGFLELLHLREDDKDKKEYLEIALKSGETMVALINDALDISKMSSGKMSIEKIEFSPLDELSSVAKLFFNSAKEKNINLRAYYDPNFPQLVYSDFHRIKQIMNNLLSNAIKFTPKEGEIFLDLLYDKERDGLTVSVKDTGIGIAKDMQKNIFTPYTQEKSSTSREYGGTGLGLSIAQQLSILLGGKLELESEEGEGSRFFFTIPCHTKSSTLPIIDKQKLKDISLQLFTSDKDYVMSVTKRYFEHFGLDIKYIQNKTSFKNLINENFNIFIISRDDSTQHEKELQDLLKQGKSVLIVGNGYLHEGYHWFEGNVRRINAPIFPHELYDSILELVNIDSQNSNIKTLKIDKNRLKDKQVLVVDDNFINLKFMNEVFKTMNIKATLAQTANEGMQKASSTNFDIIFMDENMPVMQGSEVISNIRKMEKEEKRKSSVIISLTGDANRDTKEIILEAGANDILTKPVHIQKLKEAIIQYL